MTPKELLQNCLGLTFRHVAVDSRLAGPGDLFVALPGEKVDGHHFLQNALDQGCVCALVSEKSEVDIPQIVVSDPLKFLHDIVAEYVSIRKPYVIAITGSVGKTTTKEFIKQLLSTSFRVAATPGNANSKIGIPLAVFNTFRGDEDFWVVEMGMTHPGQISTLCNMIPPTIALITHIAHVHAANFDTLEQIATAKAEIFGHKNTMVGFVNRHSGCLDTLLQAGTIEKVVVDEKSVMTRYPTLFHGKHLYQNLALAIKVAEHIGIDSAQIDQAVPFLKSEANRMELLDNHSVLILNDSYNAAEISTLAAIDTLHSLPLKSGGKKFALIGQMMELGKFSEQAHKSVAKHAVNKVDHMICYGDATKPIFDVWSEQGMPVFFTNDRTELVDYLNGHLKPGDALLLKGSRSNQLWELIPKLKGKWNK